MLKAIFRISGCNRSFNNRWSQLKQNADRPLPDMEVPYLIVVTTEPGASPEKVETDVTKPMENALGVISGVKNVTSTSSEIMVL